MLITRPGIDIIVVDETWFKNKPEKTGNKIHLIKLNFEEPSQRKIDWLIETFPLTNRFIISNNIREYNQLLKPTKKKYYIENRKGDGLFTFFRKNNKVLLNFLNLPWKDCKFILENESILLDILKNLEIIYLDEECFNKIKTMLTNWTGNVILYNRNYKL